MNAVEDLNPTLTGGGHVRDPLGVCGQCFAPVLARLMDSVDRERPADLVGMSRMVAVTVRDGRDTNVSHNRKLICDRAHVNPRKFQGYLRAEFSTVGLREADALLCAFDRPDLLESMTVLRRRALRLPAGGHACEILVPPTSSSARRLAAVEPSPTSSAPVAEAFLPEQEAA